MSLISVQNQTFLESQINLLYFRECFCIDSSMSHLRFTPSDVQFTSEIWGGKLRFNTEWILNVLYETFVHVERHSGKSSNIMLILNSWTNLENFKFWNSRLTVLNIKLKGGNRVTDMYCHIWFTNNLLSYRLT